MRIRLSVIPSAQRLVWAAKQPLGSAGSRIRVQMRHKEQTYRHGEREGQGEMYGESNVETYITICKIDSQWEFAV